MITLDLAERLRDAGLAWHPGSGDRFAIPGRDLDDAVFVVSEMTIETEQLETGALVKFNGTTEWALDSIPQAEVLWLPREGQLREALGDAFRALAPTGDGFAVEVSGVDGIPRRHVDIDAERAYARALLDVLTR